MKITLANPRGFCAGVDRAIAIVERALDIFGAPIYVRHEVVHNRFVVDGLRKRGAIFVNELNEIPDGNTVIFSAHGVSQAVRNKAEKRDLRIFDATCPLVTKVHLEVSRHNNNHNEVILIGHSGHPEVEGTMGQYIDKSKGDIYLVTNEEDVSNLSIKNPDKVGFVTQTTLSMDDTHRIIDALRNKYPNIQGPKKNDICYATQNRQDAVKDLAANCDLVLVVGSPNSSNSNRLKELAESYGKPSYLIDTAEDIDNDWLIGKTNIGLTAGASAPDILIQNVIKYLETQGVNHLTNIITREEKVVFSLPKALI